jgi:hypothetical protein
MKFKDDIVAIRFEDMNKLAQTIAIDADEWSQKTYGIELTLTSTVSTGEEDKALGRVSDTHRTRRAFDIRTKNLLESFLAELTNYLNKKYGKYGAVASAVPKLIVSKNHGTGPHLHIQLSRKYALPEIKYGKKS